MWLCVGCSIDSFSFTCVCGKNKTHADWKTEILDPLLSQRVVNLQTVFVLIEVVVEVVELEAQLLEHLDRRSVVLVDLHEELLQLHVAVRPHHRQNHRRARIPLATIGLVGDHHVELPHVAYASQPTRNGTIIDNVHKQCAVPNYFYNHHPSATQNYYRFHSRPSQQQETRFLRFTRCLCSHCHRHMHTSPDLLPETHDPSLP